jgi:hypothetical protein
VTVDDLDVDRPWRAFGAREANPPLIVDAYRVLAVPVARQRLEAMAGKRGQVSETGGGLEAVEAKLGLTLKSRQRSDPLSSRKASRVLSFPAVSDFPQL